MNFLTCHFWTSPNHAFTQSWSFYVWIIKIKIKSSNDESQKFGKILVLVFWF
jgi:hypothetical protein